MFCHLYKCLLFFIPPSEHCLSEGLLNTGSYGHNSFHGTKLNLVCILGKCGWNNTAATITSFPPSALQSYHWWQQNTSWFISFKCNLHTIFTNLCLNSLIYLASLLHCWSTIQSYKYTLNSGIINPLMDFFLFLWFTSAGWPLPCMMLAANPHKDSHVNPRGFPAFLHSA